MDDTNVIKREDGSVLIIALFMLVLLTILGVTATSTSNIELQIAGNERNLKRAFFVANSGIEHAKSELNVGLVENNEDLIAVGDDPLWTFSLDDATDSDGDGIGDYEGGVVLQDDTDFAVFNNYTYSVRIWNNDDGGGPTTDVDHIIFAQSEAKGPSNATVKLRVELYATVDGDAINSYTAQQGGESSKGYSSQDLNPIDEFTTQI